MQAEPRDKAHNERDLRWQFDDDVEAIAEVRMNAKKSERKQSESSGGGEDSKVERFSQSLCPHREGRDYI